ncbi:MAG TPA: hydroxysqualene dehydroxylase HpnE [Acidimicrobiales bacterium]|nr:hydroxysqualene dehydroxylase HpnE [Acidimicrobiales bacterium]
MRLGVIGGGLAGIAAALRAADAGSDVVLLERRPMLGGLTSSIEHNGLSFDNGQHVFLRCCTQYLAFLDRIGAADQVYLQRRLDVPVLAPNGRRATISRTALPAPLHLAGSLATYRHLSVIERARLVRAALALRRLDPDDPSLDEVSFAEWLQRHGQSARAIDRLWNLIALPTINVPAQDASLALAVKVFRVGLLDRSDGADMGWSKVPLARLHGANAQRALDAARVNTLLNASVSSIERTASGSFLLGAVEKSISVDAVIVATSPRALASFGVPAGESIAQGLGASPIVNVHLVLDRRVTEVAMAAVIDSPIEYLFDRTESSGVTSGQCLVVSLSAADRYLGVGSAQLVSTFLEALRELIPAAREAQLVDALVTRERAATFRASPGVGAFRPAMTTEVPGLFLAGAWCSTGWPATMEGAVRSGNQAAGEAWAYLSDSPFNAVRTQERIAT